MKITDVVSEAASLAQQAAIALAMKRANKKPKNEDEVKERFQLPKKLGTKRDRFKSLRKESSMEKSKSNPNGPKFTGYFKSKDSPPVGKRMVGEVKKAYGLRPLTESELRSVFGTFYLVEDLPLEKGISQVKSSVGFFQKIKNFFAIWPRVLADMVTGWLREGKQGGEAFMIWLQNINCKAGRIERCPSKDQIDWALSQRSDLAKMVAHFVLIGVLSAAVTSGLAQAGVVDAVQSIPFGTDFGTILNKLNATIADNVALGFIIKSLGFVLKKSIWEMVLQGVEVLSKYFNVTTINKSLHSLHPDKAEAPKESIRPGDRVRTNSMSHSGIVESVELYRPFNGLAVYFRTKDNQLMRTPVENVIRIPLDEATGIESNANYSPVGEYKNYPLYVINRPFNNKYIAVTVIGREEHKAAASTKEAAMHALKDKIDFFLNAQQKVSADASIDFNKKFVTDILASPREKFYAKIVNLEGQPKLVLAGTDMLTFGRELAQLGFKPSALRVDPENPDSTPLPGISYTKNQMSGLGLIANGRYIIGSMTIDPDGNRIFDLKYDSTAHTSSDKMRMPVPAITVGTRRFQT